MGGLSVSSADWYDPRTGRFLSQDPIGLAGGVNLYAYAGNNPASYSDSFGLCVPMPWCLLAGAGAGGGTVTLAGAGGTVSVAAVATAAIPAAIAVGLVVWANQPVHPAPAFHVPNALVQSDATATATARPLQNTRTGDLPARGEPNTSAVKDDGQGKGQIRDYDADGKAKTDYDFGHDHGAGDPHAHDWDWSKSPPRQPGRPIGPNE